MLTTIRLENYDLIRFQFDLQKWYKIVPVSGPVALGQQQYLFI